MSLELAVGIGAHYDSPILLYNTTSGIYSPISHKDNGREALVSKKSANLISLIEWNNQDWMIESDIKDRLIDVENIFTDRIYINCDHSIDDGIDYSQYSELVLDPNTRYNFKQNILFYSRFFKNRSTKIDKELASIRWNPPYVNLAKSIAEQIGSFSGIHLRLTDHSRVTFAVEQSGFEAALDLLEEKGLPIILSTDDKDIEWVQANRHRFIFLDDIIKSNWSDSFKKLPYNNEIIFGLICNLVLGYSKNFIGTPGSTFSGYIQRVCNTRNDNFEWLSLDGHYGSDSMAYKHIYDVYKPRWWSDHPISRLK